MFSRYRKFIKLVVLKYKLEKEIKHLAGREEQLKMEISYIEERLEATNLTQEEKKNYFLMYLEGGTMYNPYNWKIVTDSERKYKELTELSLKLNYDLTVAEQEVERIRNQLIEVDEAIENLVISDDISYDFLLSLIK